MYIYTYLYRDRNSRKCLLVLPPSFWCCLHKHKGCEEDECRGYKKEFSKCPNLSLCNECVPKDCKFNLWSDA